MSLRSFLRLKLPRGGWDGGGGYRIPVYPGIVVLILVSGYSTESNPSHNNPRSNCLSVGPHNGICPLVYSGPLCGTDPRQVCGVYLSMTQ